MKKIDIVIINYNTIEWLKRLIESIKKYTDINYKIIIVDNNSTDGSKEFLMNCKDPIKSVLLSENIGYGRGCNIGAKQGNSELIAFSNSDIELTPGWTKMLDIFKEDERIVAIGPKMIDAQNRIVAAGCIGSNRVRPLRGWYEQNSPDKYNEHYIDATSLCGAFFIVRRDIFEKVGSFDSRYELYWEETDLMFNLRSKGYRVVYTGETTIFHWWNKAPKSQDQINRCFQTGKKLFESKWGKFIEEEDRKLGY